MATQHPVAYFTILNRDIIQCYWALDGDNTSTVPTYIMMNTVDFLDLVMSEAQLFD